MSEVNSVSEALLTVLKWCVLLLLYLFFLRALQATWQFAGSGGRRGRAGARQEVGQPAAAAPMSGSGAAAGTDTTQVRRLRILAPDGLAGRAFEIKDGVTVGRAASCDLTLDDTFVSQMHARITVGPSGVVLEDLGSTNGTYLNREKVAAPAVVQPGDRIQFGSTVLELVR